MLELEGYEPGSDLTVMNIFYKYSTKDKKTGKRTKDYATIVFKDNETGRLCIESGADILVSGSYLFNDNMKERALTLLCEK